MQFESYVYYLLKALYRDTYCHQSQMSLTHLPLVLRICHSESVSNNPDNGLSPIRRQAFI